MTLLETVESLAALDFQAVLAMVERTLTRMPPGAAAAGLRKLAGKLSR